MLNTTASVDRGPAVPSPLDDPSLPGADFDSLSTETQLAVLLVESDADQADAAREEQQVARAERRTAARKQIAEMVKAADAAATGAFVSATCSVVGGGMQIMGTSERWGDASEAAKSTATEKAGSMWCSLAQPAETLAGAAPAKRHDAYAASAKNAVDEARSREDESRAARGRIDQHSDRVVELIREIKATKRAAVDAVLQDG